MKTDLLIRPMKKSDLDEASNVYLKVYKQVDIGERWTKKSAYNLLKFRFDFQPDLCFVAILDKKIVGGFLAGIKPWRDGNHLFDGEVFVDFKYQKQNIGSKLSKVIYQKALDKYKITNVGFITFSKNGYPLQWYESLGFKKVNQFVLISGNPKIVIKNLEENIT